MEPPRQCESWEVRVRRVAQGGGAVFSAVCLVAAPSHMSNGSWEIHVLGEYRLLSLACRHPWL